LGGGAAATQIDESTADAAGLSSVAVAGSGQSQSFPAVRVGPSDPRYEALGIGFNQRWVGKPAYIQVVGSTGDVIAAVREAQRRGLRITVRGGGHCYEDFVSGNPGGVIIDMSQMDGVSRSADGTFWLEGGCTLWNVYEDLYRRYGVTLPGGSCYSVGVGGHVAGGGYGLLSRQFGLTVDYLSAVEVVGVNKAGGVSAVMAKRGDRLTGDLLWGHTGAGGGNFGVITRYGFKRLPSPHERSG
jgi:FAD/FMN-containing dehydrogenase